MGQQARWGSGRWRWLPRDWLPCTHLAAHRPIARRGVAAAGHSADVDSGERQAGALTTAQYAQAGALVSAVRALGGTLKLAPPPAPTTTTPPDEYLRPLAHTVAALRGSRTAGGEAAHGGNPLTEAAEVQRALEDEREVAVELRPCPRSTACVRLTLRLNPGQAGRTSAALACKLACPAAARRQSRLRQRMQAAEADAAHRRSLLSSERAALLAQRRATPVTNPVVALARVLRSAQHQLGEAAAAALKAALHQGVLAQHKEAKKAWREKRCEGVDGWEQGAAIAAASVTWPPLLPLACRKREAGERLEALKAADMEVGAGRA